MPELPRIGDAWGDALRDHLERKEGPDLVLEVDDGTSVPAMAAEWFFRQPEEWVWWERDVLRVVASGPVLDLGAGAGRSSLFFQSLGFDVTAVESSGGAAEVCRRRGVREVREIDLNDPPDDKPWAAVLLLCGNLGLGGTWDGIRRLLARLADICAPGARIVADSVTSEGRAEIGLRIRYGDVVTPWWRQRNVAAHEVESLVDGTGWIIEHHIMDEPDHAIVLANQQGVA
jgi:SAM-dependent methyltransferase